MIRTELGGDGVLVATIDMPGRTMNVFSAELMDAIDSLMDRAESDAQVKGVVVTSGKPTFLAGADLVMVRGYCDAALTGTHEQMFEMCGRLGRQFVRLEASEKPWVAAVNGLALGGGLEMALACRARLVADEPKLQLGVPEVRWGLLPGAGGTQRLPRLAGFQAAMGLLLTGRSMTPSEAVSLGVFERAIAPGRLLDEARARALSLVGKPYDANAKFPRLAQDDVPVDSTTAGVAAANGIDGEALSHYPAYSAIIDSVLLGARLPLAEATAVEMNQFLRLMFSPVAGRMIRTLFLERLRAERELAPPEGVRIEKLTTGTVTRAGWQQALARIKVPRAEDTSLANDTLVAMDASGVAHTFALRELADANDTPAWPALVLSPAGPYGRVVEVVGASAEAAAVGAALAQRLFALPWASPGPGSVLQQLHGQDLARQAEMAAAFTGDRTFLDVAACLSGVSPPYSGGPLSWAATR